MTTIDSSRRGRPDEVSSLPVDLHAHTTASDGTLSPEALVDLAASRGLAALGVTDHDTVDALDAAAVRAARVGIALMPGVELSTTERGAEVHVLGYGVDRHDSSLRSALADLAAARYRRIAAMIEKLREAGYDIDGDAVLVQADIGTVGRPHIARALIDLGVVDSIDEAFERFLKPGRPGWVPRDPFTPEQAVGLLVEHGAVPVLAHPYSTGDIEAILDRLVPIGLRGMEVWYGEYDQARREALRRIADARGLIPTGGSDYHGPDFREGRDLGSANVPYEAFARLVEAGART
jgi:predicted metal-dependent phosphoesterase TrpH